MALYWMGVFSIVAAAAALIGFGEGTAPTGPAARLISIACLGLILLIGAGRLYLLRRQQHQRRAPRITGRHSYR